MRIAIPNKGILYEPTLRMLEDAGFGMGSGSSGGSLSSKSKNGKLSVLFARAQDIPLYVETGAADVGLTGYDNVLERKSRVKTLCMLDYGGCRIAVAVPKLSAIKSVAQLAGKRIATKMPNTAREYFAKQGVKVELLELAGATELAPNIGLADAIVDHVSTGATLEANNLREIGTILTSTSCLIANEEAAKKMPAQMNELQLAFEGISRAKSLYYLMLNVTSEAALRDVSATIPCMESPTVLPLAKKGEYAVHSVVRADELTALVPRLKNAGARDILVLSMKRVIP